mgnify:CR=1 FL=1
MSIEETQQALSTSIQKLRKVEKQMRVCRLEEVLRRVDKVLNTSVFIGSRNELVHLSETQLSEARSWQTKLNAALQSESEYQADENSQRVMSDHALRLHNIVREATTWLQNLEIGA